MRIVNGQWVCDLCGEPVDMPLDAVWRTHLQGVGGKQNARVVIVDRLEVHRCELSSPSV